MFYPEELIEEIRSKNDIVDIVSQYVKIQKKGSNYFGLCPFHNEKSGSFSVSPNKQMYYCFGCHASGNVYTFLQKYENYTFQEAIQTLAQRAGVALPEVEYSEETKRKQSYRAKLLEVNKEAAKYYYYQLRAPQGQAGLEYFKKRELTDETMQRFGLGYANVTSDDLTKYLKSKGYDDKLIMDAGLASHNEKYGLHDKFWSRVMFPIQDANHRVIAFGGRVMGQGEPKYLNSPETEIFDKSHNLYGLNFARSTRKNYFILCEGYMDVISMHQAGFDCAMASLGTSFTSGHAAILKRFKKDIILSYDSDGPGVSAALRALERLKEVGMTGKVLNLEPYKDPDEFIKALGSEAFEERIKAAENGFMFEIRIISREFDLNDPEGKTSFHRRIAEKLCEFTEDVARDNYMEAVAEAYSINLENLRNLVKKYAAIKGDVSPIARPRSTVREKEKPEDKKKKPQKLFLTWLVDTPGLYEKVKKYISKDDFTEGIYRLVAEKLFEQFESGTMNPASIISMFEDEAEQSEAASLFNTKLSELEDIRDREKEFNDILYVLKKNSYEYYNSQIGTDVDAFAKSIKEKKLLENISKLHIKLED